MPIPTPKSNEKESDFMKRCMSNKVMTREFKRSQRYAICNDKWEDNKNGKIL